MSWTANAKDANFSVSQFKNDAIAFAAGRFEKSLMNLAIPTGQCFTNDSVTMWAGSDFSNRCEQSAVPCRRTLRRTPFKPVEDVVNVRPGL
ncbi:MAG TPA: hypothetical protein VE988_27745, partial [Gemmataceae bacterium]|nr:hypothetical protein [Gemmataceae bacterium]